MPQRLGDPFQRIDGPIDVAALPGAPRGGPYQLMVLASREQGEPRQLDAVGCESGPAGIEEGAADTGDRRAVSRATHTDIREPLKLRQLGLAGRRRFGDI